MQKILKYFSKLNMLMRIAASLWVLTAIFLIALIALLITFGDNSKNRQKTVNFWRINSDNTATDSSAKALVNLKEKDFEKATSDIYKHLASSTTTSGVIANTLTSKVKNKDLHFDYRGIVTGGGKAPIGHYTVDTYLPPFTKTAQNKSNGVAAVATLFTIGMVGSIGLTVAGSIKKQKGGNN